MVERSVILQWGGGFLAGLVPSELVIDTFYVGLKPTSSETK